MRLFKKYTLIGLILLLALMTSIPATALDSVFCKSMTGTTTAGTLTGLGTYAAYVTIPGDNNSQVIVASLSATADGAAHNMSVYDKEDTATVSAAASATDTAITISSGGTSFDVDDLVIFQSPSGATIFLEKVTATAATTLTVTAIDYDITAGYVIYEMESIATIPVGSATASYESDIAVAAGQKNSPLLIAIPGTSACSINFASGQYR